MVRLTAKRKSKNNALEVTMEAKGLVIPRRGCDHWMESDLTFQPLPPLISYCSIELTNSPSAGQE